jgi:triosephosphate isomerase
VVCEKVRAALKHHLIPIVCIGETEKERKSGAMIDVVLAQQMDAIFGNLSKMQAEKIVLAYEPRWAIGTDQLPTTQEIFQVRIMIRKWLMERLGDATEGADFRPVRRFGESKLFGSGILGGGNGWGTGGKRKSCFLSKSSK